MDINKDIFLPGRKRNIRSAPSVNLSDRAYRRGPQKSCATILRDEDPQRRDISKFVPRRCISMHTPPKSLVLW